MKRKIFSKLLMVAMLVASVSMFVSCKDYDDDIKKNSDAISSLQQTLNNLQSALDQAKSDAATAHATFATKVELGQVDAAVKALQEEIKTLATKKALEDAIAEVNAAIAKGATKEELEELSKTLAAVDEKLAGDLTAYKETTDAAIETANKNIAKQEEALAALAALVATKADKTAVEEAVKALEAAIKAGDDKNAAAITALKTALEKAISEGDAANKALIDALTEVVGTKADATALAAAVEKLEAAIAKLATETTTALGTKADKTALEALKTLVNAKADITSVEALSTALTDQITAAVDRLAAVEKTLEEAGDIKDVKEAMKEADDAIRKEVGDRINLLQLFVNKRITSVVLKPNFYWEGLEAVELPFANSLTFHPVSKDYTFTYAVKDPVKGNTNITVKVENVMTAQLEKARKVNNKDVSYVVLEGSNGETITNNAAVIAKIWDNEGKSLDNATIINKVNTALNAQNITFDGLKNVNLEEAAVATYHINPATAELEGVKIGFVDNIVPTYTRAAGEKSAGIGAYAVDGTYTAGGEVNTFENGILTVPFKVDYDKVLAYFQNWTLAKTDQVGKNAAGNNVWAGEPSNQAAPGTSGYGYNAQGEKTYTAELPYIAVALSTNDTTVVSDYAVVVPATYTIVALADTKALDKVNGVDTKFNKTPDANAIHKIRANHMYESVGYNGITAEKYNVDNYGAITMPATREVAWNDTLEIEGIEVHADYTTYAQYGKSTQDKALNATQLAALGLHFEYTLVEYIKGVEVTGESCHMVQIGDKTSNKFSPRQVNEDTGATLNTQNRNTIGREPLVRVDLVDEEGNIVRYGYLKIRIVDTAQQTQDKYVTINFDDMYFNCGDAYKVKWYQMEGKILAILGTDGLTKQEFEKQYYMEVVAGDFNAEKKAYPSYQTMPAQRVQTVAQDGVDAPKGTLYKDASDNKWMAVRYYNAGTADAPKMTLVGDKDDVTKWNATQNWFGHVWYTPHDNATDAQNWDEQTNVIEWNFDNSDGEGDNNKGIYKTNMGTAGYYTALMKAVGATYDTKGLNANALSTVIRFINKATGASVWVTLNAPVNKLHFAYADINRRVLDHWYSMTKGYANSPEKTDTIEVYANVPTPAEVTRPELGTFSDAAGVTPQGFFKMLPEYWLGSKVMIDLYDKAHFTKFWNTDANPDKCNITFQFRLPEEGVNADFSAAADGTWTAPGASGTIWTVKLNAAKNEIQAVKKGNTVLDPVVTICELDAQTGKIHWLGRTENADAAYLVTDGAMATPEHINEPANDILNYIGMYDATGKLQRDSYLTGQKDKTFAAYVEIKVANTVCYDPLIGKNYFNVRFLRPINVWPAKTSWKDAKNETQIYDIWKLLYMRDWRQYAIVMDEQTQKFGDAAVAGTGEDGKDHKGEYSDANNNVPYSFYNIQNLYIERSDIRSDAYLPKEQRIVLTDPAQIAALYSIDEIPALTGTNGGEKWEYFKLMNAGTTAIAAGTTATGNEATKTSKDVLAYTNNGGVVSTFHIYVPISVKYSHGALKPWTQKVWAVITIEPTQGNEDNND